MIMDEVKYLTLLNHVNKVNYLQTFCSAIRNLPSMILIREGPRSFGNVTVHAFEVPRRIVFDLFNFSWKLQ